MQRAFFINKCYREDIDAWVEIKGLWGNKSKLSGTVFWELNASPFITSYDIRIMFISIVGNKNLCPK